MDKAARALEIRRLLEAERKKPGAYQDMQRLLSRYALERFLFRLGASPQGSRSALTGSLRVAVEVPEAYRVTADAELILYGRYTRPSLLGMLQTIAGAKLDDGMTFRAGKIGLRDIAGLPSSYAVAVPAMLGNSPCDVNLELRLDLGPGDPPPLPNPVSFPSLLKLPRPKLRVVPLEAVVAERLAAVVRQGGSGARLKDWYDLAVIATHTLPKGEDLKHAIAAEFERSGVTLPEDLPALVETALGESKARQDEWKALLRKAGAAKGPDLSAARSAVLQLLSLLGLLAVGEAGSPRSEAASW